MKTSSITALLRLLVLSGLVAVAFSSCATMRGMGEDISTAGDNITKSAE